VATYSTGLIQNFTFKDNNVVGPNSFSYLSWIDVNYFTSSMTNIAKGNTRYDSEYGIIVSDGNLKGFPTKDVLSSESIFRNSYDVDYKSYNLGWAYKVYVDYINQSSYFTYPLNTAGAPGVNTFLENGWVYSNNSTQYRSNLDPGGLDSGRLEVIYNQQTFNNVGFKSVQTGKFTFLSNISNMSTSNDFSVLSTGVNSTPSGSVTSIEYTPIGGGTTYLNSYFSRINELASSWTFENNYITSADILSYPVIYRSYPSKSISPFNNNNVIGDTDIANRKVYMMDWFNTYETSSSYDGYNNPGLPGNPGTYSKYTNTSSGVTFSAYMAPNATTLTVNAFVPFTFKSDEGGGRGGWSAFKFIGVVEKCTNDSLATVESNWSVVGTTKLQYYAQSAEPSSGNNMGLDLDKCAIVWDSDMHGIPFIGGLYINNMNISVDAGNLIRFRVYFVNVRKMFNSYSDGPGGIHLQIGVDPLMGYSQNNHGYFEVYDTSSYVNANTNILDNTFTNAIPKLRYSLVDFDLYDVSGNNPSIYLLSNNPLSSAGGFSTKINHADAIGNRKEYFYNRSSLQMFFNATSSFDARFSRISFYETDMIPFFRYATESSIYQTVINPYYGVNSSGVSFDNTITLNSSIYGLIGVVTNYP
jgi:hypothetical protein